MRDSINKKKSNWQKFKDWLNNIFNNEKKIKDLKDAGQKANRKT